jgi:hypothetical protein
MAEKSIMARAEEILGKYGVGHVSTPEPVIEEAITKPSPMKHMPLASTASVPNDYKELPDVPDNFRDRLFENIGIATTPRKPKEPKRILEDKTPTKRNMTIQEMKIVLQAAKILSETTFAGSLGVNMAGSSSFEATPKKKIKKKKGKDDLKEFANTTDPNVWKPEKNNMYTRKPAVAKLTSSILRKLKK